MRRTLLQRANGTDRRTPCRYIDRALHSMRAMPMKTVRECLQPTTFYTSKTSSQKFFDRENSCESKLFPGSKMNLNILQIDLHILALPRWSTTGVYCESILTYSENNTQLMCVDCGVSSPSNCEHGLTGKCDSTLTYSASSSGLLVPSHCATLHSVSGINSIIMLRNLSSFCKMYRHHSILDQCGGRSDQMTSHINKTFS